MITQSDKKVIHDENIKEREYSSTGKKNKYTSHSSTAYISVKQFDIPEPSWGLAEVYFQPTIVNEDSPEPKFE